MKRPHEDKITFSLAYRTQFFHTTCAQLDLAHAVLLERAQSDTLRTECEKGFFRISLSQSTRARFCAFSASLYPRISRAPLETNLVNQILLTPLSHDSAHVLLHVRHGRVSSATDDREKKSARAYTRSLRPSGDEQEGCRSSEKKETQLPHAAVPALPEGARWSQNPKQGAHEKKDSGLSSPKNKTHTPSFQHSFAHVQASHYLAHHLLDSMVGED